MQLFPHEDLYIITNLTDIEVQNKLQSSIYIPGITENSKQGQGYDIYSVKYFLGFAIGNVFDIKPDINYRNSFLPQIKGTIESYNTGSKIHVKMTLFSFALVFLTMILGFTALGGTYMILTATKFEFSLLLPYAGFIFAYFLALFSFKYESRRCKNILLDIFEGQICE